MLTHSLPAPRSAVDLGTDMLELDCHLTKDEQVVVSHDPNLRRVCGMNANISELAYAVSSCAVTAVWFELVTTGHNWSQLV